MNSRRASVLLLAWVGEYTRSSCCAVGSEYIVVWRRSTNCLLDGSRTGRSASRCMKCERTAREKASKLQSVGVAGGSAGGAARGRDERTNAAWRLPHGTVVSKASVMPWMTCESSRARATAMVSPLYSIHTQSRTRAPLAPVCVSAYLRGDASGL